MEHTLLTLCLHMSLAIQRLLSWDGAQWTTLCELQFLYTSLAIQWLLSWEECSGPHFINLFCIYVSSNSMIIALTRIIVDQTLLTPFLYMYLAIQWLLSWEECSGPHLLTLFLYMSLAIHWLLSWDGAQWTTLC